MSVKQQIEDIFYCLKLDDIKSNEDILNLVTDINKSHESLPFH